MNIASGQQSVYLILQDLSKNNYIENRNFNFLVEKIFQIAHTYIRHNRTRIPSFILDGGSKQDLAIEAISVFFIKNKNNFYPISNSFDTWVPNITNEDETLFFLYKIISLRVEQFITKSLKEADPVTAKILDSLKYLIKKNGYQKKKYFGQKFICNSTSNNLDRHLVTAIELENLPSSYFQNTDKIFENIFNYFGKDSESNTAIPLNLLATRIKSIRSFLDTNDFKNDNVESLIFVDDVIASGYNLAYSILINSYFKKGKISEIEVEAYNKTLQDLAEDLKNGGINPGLFKYFKKNMNSISEEIYLKKYHNKLEYLLKIMRTKIKDILEKSQLAY